MIDRLHERAGLMHHVLRGQLQTTAHNRPRATDANTIYTISVIQADFWAYVDQLVFVRI